MAVAAVVAGTAFASTTNATSYATASWTPTDGKLYLVCVTNTHASAVDTVTLAGNGQTWASILTKATAGLDQRVTVFRALAASSSAGALTATSGTTQTGCIIHISEWTGMDTGGTNGSAAIVQSVGADWVSTANPSVTLATFGSVDNGTYGAFSTGNADPSVGSGFTVLREDTYLTPTRFTITEWRATNDTGVDVTAGAHTGCGIGIEIKAASSATNAAAGHASGTGTAL